VNALQKIFSTRTCIAHSHYPARAAVITEPTSGLQAVRCNNSAAS
jgi:hypothetical protein